MHNCKPFVCIYNFTFFRQDKNLFGQSPDHITEELLVHCWCMTSQGNVPPTTLEWVVVNDWSIELSLNYLKFFNSKHQSSDITLKLFVKVYKH